MLHREAAKFYKRQLHRVADILGCIGDLDALEPMEAAAVAKTVLTRIAFVAEETQCQAEDDDE